MSDPVRLGDIADVLSGVGFPKELQGQSDGEVPVFKVGDISNAVKSGTRYLRTSPNHLSKEAARRLAANLMPAGTTVFAKIGEGLKLNRRAILAQPSLVDNNVMGLVPRTGVATSAYLYFFMQTIDLGELSQATAVPSVRRSDVVEISIPLPPMHRQEVVVAEIEKQFSRLDEAVTNLQRVKANLKRYKAAVLKAAVEGRLVPTEADLARGTGRSFEAGAQLLTRVLDIRRSDWKGKGRYGEPNDPEVTTLNELPEGWTWATVEQLNPANRPCAYGVLQPGADVSDGVPFVRVGDIDDGRIELTGMKAISPAIAAAYPRTRLLGGEVLLTLVGAIGRTAVVRPTLSGANVARAVGVLPILTPIEPHWVEIWFRNPAKIAEMDGKSHEVARKTLNLEDVRSATIAIPPIAEQHRIVAEVDRRLSIVREVEAEVDANLKRAQALRQSVLQAAFACKLPA